MSAVKTFLIGSVVLFGAIGAAAWIKQNKLKVNEVSKESVSQLVEIPIIPAPATKVVTPKPVVKPLVEQAPISADHLPDVDRISRLFALDSSKLPIVETISFTSRVPWLKGRPAWISDYASFYETSRHFIARSLNRKLDYFTQKVSPGARFNVFRKDKNISFHMLIDLSRCRMWLYYFDKDAGERTLLKTYRVGLGRQDSSRASGYLTPVGKYEIGERVAIYKPGNIGLFQDEKTEMIRVFGTRWIPFEKEIEGCSEEAKGFGLHGSPWVSDSSGALIEDVSRIGKYDSDGCVRLASSDIEEIFAIILTKPTVVELVKDYSQAKLPGVEKGVD